MNQVTIVKLGGSAITDKNKECTPDIPTICASTSQLSSYRKPLILLHGGGSYGHPIVSKARLHEGLKAKSQLTAIAETELAINHLTRIVQVSLLRRKIPFAPFNPMSFLTTRDGHIQGLFVRPLREALKLGLTPVVHGDLAFDIVKGISVVSADQLASRLGNAFRGARVLFGCDVDGVFTSDPKNSGHTRMIRTVDQSNARQVLRSLRKATMRDTTGGMYNKVKEALKLAKSGRHCYIFNLRKPGLMTEALAGKLSSGTTFPAWKLDD